MSGHEIELVPGDPAPLTAEFRAVKPYALSAMESMIRLGLQVGIVTSHTYCMQEEAGDWGLIIPLCNSIYIL